MFTVKMHWKSILMMVVGLTYSLPAIAQSDTVQIELISPKNCTVRNKRLRFCKIPQQDIHATLTDSAIPLRSRVKHSVAGNCSIQYSLEVAFEGTNLQPTSYRYLRDESTALIANDRGILSSFTIRDISPWTSSAIFDESCAVSIELILNEPDFGTKEEGAAFLASMQQTVEKARKELGMLKDLLAYASAFEFLKAIADSLYTELTTDRMQELRTSAVSAQPVLQALVEENEKKYDDETIFMLYSFFGALPQLGQAPDWKNPDGEVKTLWEFVAEKATNPDRAKTAIDVILQLAGSHNPQKLAEYQRAFEAKALEVSQLEAKLTRAQSQLSSWLSGQ